MEYRAKRVGNAISIAVYSLALLLLSAQLGWSNHLPAGDAGGIGAHPNIVKLAPSSYEIARGSIFTVNVGVDFTDLLMGGSVHLAYDETVVEVLAFSFAEDPAAPMVVDYSPFPDGAFLTWGWFELAPQYSVSGFHLIGTLLLRATEAGLVSLSASAVAVGTAAGPLVGPGSAEAPLSGTPLDVIYETTHFYIVPEPSTAAMLLIGLTILQFRLTRLREIRN